MTPPLRPPGVLRQRLREGHYAEVRDEIRAHPSAGLEHQKCLCDALAQLRDWQAAAAVAEAHLGRDPYFRPLLLAKFAQNARDLTACAHWLDRALAEEGETLGYLTTASKAAAAAGDKARAIAFGQRVLSAKDAALSEAVPEAVPVAPLTGGTRKIVAFSLFGTGEVYLFGALANARLWPRMAPDWTCRFHVAPDVPPGIAQALTRLGAEVIPHDDPGVPAYMARFLPLQDASVARFICRDVDCRPTMREIAILREWEAAPQGFHLIRNHVLHTDLVLAGLWGGRPIAGFDLATEIAEAFPRGASNKYGLDQQFLEHRIWARIRGDLLTHDQHYRLDGIETRPVDDPDLGGGHRDLCRIRQELADLGLGVSPRD